MKKITTIRLLAILSISMVVILGILTCASDRNSDSARSEPGLKTDLAGSALLEENFTQKALYRKETKEAGLTRGDINLDSGSIAYYAKKDTSSDTVTLAPEAGEMELVDFGPSGELPIEQRRPTVYVMFNHPVVPLAKLGEPIRESPFMKIEPAVNGTYRWYGTRVLSFEPDEPMVSSPRYVVTISADVKSLGGRRLGKPFTFDFYTEVVKIVNFYPGNSTDSRGNTWEVPTAMARYMILEFNQPVDTDHIAQGLAVFVRGKEVEFTVTRPQYPEQLSTRTPRAVQVTLTAEPPENSRVELILKKGAAPFPTYPETKEDQKKSLQTVTPFVLEELDSYSYDMPRNNKPGAIPVYARFSHPLAKGAETRKWSVTVNRVPWEPVGVDFFGSTVRINLEGIESGDVVEVKAAQDVQDIYGRYLTNPGQARTTQIPEAYAYISFPYRSFYHLETQFPPRFIWEARNMGEINLGIGTGNVLDWMLRRPELPVPRKIDVSKWERNRVHYRVEDLAPHLNVRGYGTVFVNWNAKHKTDTGRQRTEASNFVVQVTDMGITTRYAYNRALVWVHSLSTGKPIAGASVTILGDYIEDKQGITDASGLAVLDFWGNELNGFIDEDRYYQYDLHIRVEKDDDVAELFSRNSHNIWTSSLYGYQNPQLAQEPAERVMLFTDRGLYKGGEELALRGIHWTQRVSEFVPYSGNYTLVLKDPRDGRLLWQETGRASESGGFAHRFMLPEDLEPGSYSIRYEIPGYRSGVSFTIAQFRRLAFQVTSSKPDRPFFMGDEASVDIKASYLAGGTMGGASYDYYWTRKPTGYVPPGPDWKNHVFGPGIWEGERYLSRGKGKLSPSGGVVLKERTDGQNASGSAYNYVLETTVQDLDRQAVASAATALVHPASFYIGARFLSTTADGWWSRFVSTGKEVKTEAVLVAPEGDPWEGDATLKATLTIGKWKATEQQGVYGRVNTRWEYVEEEVRSEELHTKKGKATWSFTPEEAGDYILSFEGKDSKGRFSKTGLRFYATGSAWARNALETPSTIELIPDKEEYLPGETARILVRSPLSYADYLLTVERQGIFSEKVIHIGDGNSLLEIPITAEHVPVIYVALTSYTKREGAPSDYFEPDLGKPRSLFGILGLKVSTKPVELDVEVSSVDGAYKPGTTAEVLVRVTQDGVPVAGGEVTLMAVDRGVLDLINYHVPNPIDFFYDPSNFPLAVHGDDSRRLLLKPVAYDTASLTGGDGEKPQGRKDFRPLALFEPFVRTDEKGEARVSFSLPDNLTTYRLTAVALQGAKLGLAEGELLVQNPVNVRTALPRRFRHRDTAAAGVILQNLTKTPQKVEVSVQSDLLTLEGDTTREVEIPPSGVYELPFVLAATNPGEGYISFTVKSAVVNEKLTEKVLVERPLIKEAFSTVGSIAADGSSAQEGLAIPSAIAPGYGSLTVKAASTLRPYIDPSMDRLLGPPESWWGYYRRILYSFASVYEGKNEAEVQRLLTELAGRQLPEGGIYTSNWSWQPYLADAYISLLTAHFQLFAESRGWKAVSGPDRAELLSYLQTLKPAERRFGPYYKAYLAYVLSASGKTDVAYLKKVEAYEDELGLGGYGLLAQAYLASGDRTGAERVYKRSKNFVSLGTQMVDVKETYEATSYWSSLLAELAMILKNAHDLGEDPGFIQRVAGSLNRSERYWRTLNDDLWTLLGFVPLLDSEGADAGTAGLKVHSGRTELGSFELGAGSVEAEQVLEFDEAPLADLKRDVIHPLDFTKTGDSTLYYTTILRYALPNETAFARDEGIEVDARYETLEGKAVAEDELVLGETYRVRVNVSTTKRRQRLELLVPIPNGVEIVDPSFATTGRFADQGGTGDEIIERETVYGDSIQVSAEGYGHREYGYWYWYYYHPDSFALDNMMVYRWTDFYAGRRELTFLVRVTTPGIYPTPPASASLEFEPEVFGRSDGKLFVIKP